MDVSGYRRQAVSSFLVDRPTACRTVGLSLGGQAISPDFTDAE
ncbi:hypothetical protein SynBIOSE41_03811 [Synechococcus sp. BIOS-E4-1]|nr:hypothetical protein SynBIOSE41_03811 [Synechococcus sp. BIOS-E4-1]